VAKLTAWLMTLVGVLLILPLIGVPQLGVIVEGTVAGWLVALSFLVIGIGKLARNYSARKRK
jgi:hypothetical protein